MTETVADKFDILVVDDDINILRSVKAILLSSGMEEPALCSDSRQVMELISNHSFKVVLLDILMPNKNGMDLLFEIKEEAPAVECVMVTAVDDVTTAVKAMKFGAYDYLVKPFSSDKLIETIRNAFDNYEKKVLPELDESAFLFENLKHPAAFKSMVAKDKSMARIFHQVEMIAATDYNVIITGESGTGKEMLSRIIHQLSRRSEGPFIGVNMAAFNNSLFENDFFGHIKGAYTGAESSHPGFFETAAGGTLFLDEITEMDLELQAKLLRVIQEEEFYRLGSTRPSPVDVRFIASSNSDIIENIRKGLFRKDLFYRLNTCHIHIPPLRKRKEDIIALSRYFLGRHAKKNDKCIAGLSEELKTYLLSYPFNGNVRELENLIAYAVLLETGRELTLASVQQMMASDDCPMHMDFAYVPLEEMERHHILKVLEDTNGNRTRTAKILGVGLRTLQRRLKDYGINP